MPPAARSLRLLAFMVPAILVICGIQPVLAALTGGIPAGWAAELSGPTVLAAAAAMATARLTDRGNDPPPPPWSAYALLPGSFLLAGAAAMDIFGALVTLPSIATACWVLLVAGTTIWVGALVLVRRSAR